MKIEKKGTKEVLLLVSADFVEKREVPDTDLQELDIFAQVARLVDDDNIHLFLSELKSESEEIISLSSISMCGLFKLKREHEQLKKSQSLLALRTDSHKALHIKMLAALKIYDGKICKECFAKLKSVTRGTYYDYTE